MFKCIYNSISYAYFVLIHMSNSLSLFLQLASTCSATNFPITNYSVVVSEASQSGSGIEEVGRKSYNFTEEQSIVMPIVVDLPQLMQEREYQVFVEACINITCRTTPSIPLSKCSASDTQCRCLSCTNTQTPCLGTFPCNAHVYCHTRQVGS